MDVYIVTGSIPAFVVSKVLAKIIEYKKMDEETFLKEIYAVSHHSLASRLMQLLPTNDS